MLSPIDTGSIATILVGVKTRPLMLLVEMGNSKQLVVDWWLVLMDMGVRVLLLVGI